LISAREFLLMIILVALHGVIADLYQGFLAEWVRQYPDRSADAWKARTGQNPMADCPAQWRDEARAILEKRGFIAGLPPVDGAVQAIKALRSLGQDIRIYASPLDPLEHAESAQRECVARHLGQAAAETMIMTNDRTAIEGHVLIDTQPDIAGTRTPLWRHIVFDAAYNQHVLNAPRMTWHNWRSVLAGEMYRHDE